VRCEAVDCSDPWADRGLVAAPLRLPAPHPLPLRRAWLGLDRHSRHRPPTPDVPGRAGPVRITGSAPARREGESPVNPSARMRSVLLRAGLLASLFVAPHAAAAGRGVAREVVQIKAGDGLGLEGSFYKPANKGAPGVLLVHDAGASRAQLESLAERLNKEGFGVLAVDLRGHGGSKSEQLDWDKLSDAEKKTAWSGAAKDIDAAAAWLSEQPTIRGTSLALAGFGAGCALVVRQAKGNENVVCMALLDPHSEDYGFDVKSDIQTLVGLPTGVACAKDSVGHDRRPDSRAWIGVLLFPLPRGRTGPGPAMPQRRPSVARNTSRTVGELGSRTDEAF